MSSFKKKMESIRNTRLPWKKLIGIVLVFALVGGTYKFALGDMTATLYTGLVSGIISAFITLGLVNKGSKKESS